MIRTIRSWARNTAALRSFRLVRLWWTARHGAHYDWHSTLAADADLWQKARTEPSGPRVLMATGVGLHFGATQLDSLLAIALTLRGARVESLLCDALLPACMAADESWEGDLAQFSQKGMSRNICHQCIGPARSAYAALKLPVHAYGEFVDTATRASISQKAQTIAAHDIPDAVTNGIAVGEHAVAGSLRFFGRGTLESAPHWESVLRAFFEAALLAEAAFTELFTRYRFDVVVAHHGIYVPQGICVAVARRMGVRVVTWNVAYRRKCFIFSHDDSYHHTLLGEPTTAWENITLDDKKEEKITSYLASRAQGSQDWISFQRPRAPVSRTLADEFNLDAKRPCIGLLTNVFWDAQLHFPKNIFPSMREWLIETVRYFATRPELQLVIRVHPAEVLGAIPSREPATEILHDAFGQMPENVIVVPPDHPANTYELMQDCNAVIIFGTKMGIELAATGKPVIVAGEAWIRNKGISIDPASRDEYFDNLDQLPLPTNAGITDRKKALKYAYHYFFRRMIPVNCIDQTDGFPPFKIGNIDMTQLEAGTDSGLDVICNGILKGEPFIYDSEPYIYDRR